MAYKMKSKSQYFGRIHIDPRPLPVSTAIAKIRSWFGGLGWTTVFLSGRPGPWEGEPFGSKPWGIAISGTPQSTLQAPIQGTTPLDHSGPSPVTVWFSAVWLGPDGTDVKDIQKTDDGQSGYRVYDMFSIYDNEYVLRDGELYSGGSYSPESQEGGFGPGGEPVGPIPESTSTGFGPISPPPTSLPSKAFPGSKFDIPKFDDGGWWLQQGKWYEGTFRANVNIGSVNNSIQSFGFTAVSTGDEFPLSGGSETTFSGQWTKSTGNYPLKTNQYEIISLQEKPILEDSPKGKPELDSEDYSWQPTRPPFEDTGNRPSPEDYRGERETETESSSNTALWILGILGVSVAGYLALKGKK